MYEPAPAAGNQRNNDAPASRVHVDEEVALRSSNGPPPDLVPRVVGFLVNTFQMVQRTLKSILSGNLRSHSVV
jgi:hypothetical protein